MATQGVKYEQRNKVLNKPYNPITGELNSRYQKKKKLI